MAERFRAGVGIIVLDAAGRALAGERTGTPGSWQLPQGGLREGETPLDGAYRELHEEMGLGRGDVELVAEVPEWLGYELPAAARNKKIGRGQVHKWFVLRARHDEPAIDLEDGGEFRAACWMDLGELATIVVEFRQPVYRRLAAFVGQL